jgi:hypothetical protein
MNDEISNIIIMLSSEPENEKLELQFFLLRKETGRKGKKKKKILSCLYAEIFQFNSLFVE